MPKHGLGRQAHLAKEALGTTTWEIKHRLGVRAGLRGVADDGHIVPVLNVQHGAGSFVGQALGHFFVHKVNHLRLQRRCPHGCRRRVGLLTSQAAQHGVGQALGLHAPAGELVRHLNGLWIDRAHHPRLESRGGAETLSTHFAQQVAHVHGHVAKVNLHRARRGAFVADRAVVGHVFKLFPVPDGNATTGLLFVQKGFNQERGGQNFVAWAVEQIGARHMGGAYRFAFAAAQAVFDRVRDGPDVRLLHDQRLVAHQAKAGGVGLAQVGIFQQLAFVEMAIRVDAGFVISKRFEFLLAQILEFGDANAVFTRDDAIQGPGQSHDAVHRLVRGL